MPFEFHTFGCKVNSYDTGLLEQSLKPVQGPKVHVINSCAVTGEASREAARLARRIKARDPFSKVVVTGCAAQVDTDLYDDIPGVDLIVANSHKGRLNEILDGHFKGNTQRVFKSNIFEKKDLEAGGGLQTGRTRSFLKVQDGCNSFCTYCVIPFARGKSRSIPIWDLIERVNQLAAEGVREVVITGIHIGDYEDEGAGLPDLVDKLLRFTSGVRFRISSLEPLELTDELLDLYSDSRMCPHFHMSIQHTDSLILQKMKRQYSGEDVVEVLEKIRHQVPGAFVGMDLIVGFPGETEIIFENSLAVLQDLYWSKIHVFPYSERPGTYAARLKDTVPWAERKVRSKQMRHLSDVRYRQLALQQVGTRKKMLNLSDSGICEDYWSVRLPIGRPIGKGEMPFEEPGDRDSGIVDVRITDCLPNQQLIAEVVT